MRNEEAPQLKARLDELADYYRVKPETTASMRVWVDVLKPCFVGDILPVLTDWPGREKRYPTAEQIMLLCQEMAAKRDRARVRTDSEATIEAAIARSAAAERGPESQAIADRALREIRAAMAQPKPHPLTWLDKLHERQDEGEILTSIQHAYMREGDIRVFGSLAAAVSARRRGVTAVKRRTEDQKMDETALEARNEREAIQGEAA